MSGLEDASMTVTPRVIPKKAEEYVVSNMLLIEYRVIDLAM